MEGFYSKGEAARILGVSVRQIQLYCQAGKLTRINEGKKAFIPISDVDRLYNTRGTKATVKRSDVEVLEERLKKVEATVNVLKLGLGFGAERPPRTEAELLVFRQNTLTLLGRASWPIRDMSEFADEMVTLHEGDAQLLYQMKGARALVPFFDLLRRMIRYTEAHPSYPENGLDTLHARMVRARDRTLGLLHVASIAKTDLAQEDAEKLLDFVDLKPGQVDRYLARYIASKREDAAA